MGGDRELKLARYDVFRFRAADLEKEQAACEGAMPYAEEARRVADALGIPAAARPSPAAASLVAVDFDLPESRPEWLDMAHARYENSQNGVAW